MSFQHLDDDEKAIAKKLAHAFSQTLQEGYIRDKRGPCPSVFHDACAQMLRRSCLPKPVAASFAEKPVWTTSPQWAQWLAFEADGHWLWLSHKPSVEGQKWSKPNRARGGMHLYIDAWESEQLARRRWWHFLEERPAG